MKLDKISKSNCHSAVSMMKLPSSNHPRWHSTSAQPSSVALQQCSAILGGTPTVLSHPRWHSTSAQPCSVATHQCSALLGGNPPVLNLARWQSTSAQPCSVVIHQCSAKVFWEQIRLLTQVSRTKCNFIDINSKPPKLLLTFIFSSR